MAKLLIKSQKQKQQKETGLRKGAGFFIADGVVELVPKPYSHHPIKRAGRKQGKPSGQTTRKVGTEGVALVR